MPVKIQNKATGVQKLMTDVTVLTSIFYIQLGIKY